MGIFNRIRDMFNSGELKPAEHIGQIELVKNEANKASELTWGYNEAYFDHMREQKKQRPKTIEQVNVESLKKEIEGGTRPQLGNYEEIPTNYMIGNSNLQQDNSYDQVQAQQQNNNYNQDSKEEEHSMDI